MKHLIKSQIQLLAVFIAGLMVGRTPEYLGKKIESKEIKMAMLAVLVLALGILVVSAFAASTRAGCPERAPRLQALPF